MGSLIRLRPTTSKRSFRPMAGSGDSSGVMLMKNLRSLSVGSLDALTQKQNIALGSWRNMKSRCLSRNNPKYRLYGGRGISVCDRWLESGSGFRNFSDDMGPRPSFEYVIDRIDNDKNYEPGNCRWVTWEFSRKHRRKHRGPNIAAKLLLSTGRKRCSRCASVKLLSEFHHSRTACSGRASPCKACRKT